MKIAERRAALGKGPVYLYYFRWETPADGGRLKSPHTIEIPFAFDNVKAATRLTGGGPEAMALADKVSDAWIAFAQDRQSEYAEAATLDALQRDRSSDDGDRQREQAGQRSDSGAAPRDVQGVGIRLMIALDRDE